MWKVTVWTLYSCRTKTMCTCLAWLPLVSDKVILYENCKKVWLHLLLCIIWNTANCASWWHYYEFVLNGSWVSLSFFGAYVCCVVTGLPECTQTCMLPLPVLTLTEISSFGQTRTAWICLWPGHSSRSVTNGCHKGHSLVSRTIQSTWELCNGHNTVMQPRMEEKWENSVGLSLENKFTHPYCHQSKVQSHLYSHNFKNYHSFHY